MPRHHFGFSVVGGLVDMKILTTDPFSLKPESRNQGFKTFVAYDTLKSHC
jgi:hypothetical protein